ncbi:MAG: ABC transporter ATP-binding protein [Bacillota bacterium]
MEKQAMVELVDVAKSFGDVDAVKGISLEIFHGEFITLLGPSGCGKTTTLRMIGGFEEPDRGDVLIEGLSVKGKKPFQRDVNTVFQSYALFPHMNVFNNVAFGMKMKNVKEKEFRPRIEEALSMVKMDQYADRLPKQLSGGEQQRIAVARAIVNNPRVLLLDEPLGALDLKLRKQMQVELKHLQKKLNMTFIYVTHDQEEALVMSDRVVVMNNGLVEQVDTPTEVYRYPKSRFVADFIGDTNLLQCTVRSIKDELLILDYQGTSFKSLARLEGIAATGDKGYLSIRPEEISISEQEPQTLQTAKEPLSINSEINVLPAVVEEIIFVGSNAKLIARTKTSTGFRITAHTSLASGNYLLNRDVFLSWEPGQSVFVTE